MDELRDQLWESWRAGYNDALYYHNMDDTSDPNVEAFKNWLINVMQISAKEWTPEWTPR